jgi:hypothetical protein
MRLPRSCCVTVALALALSQQAGASLIYAVTGGAGGLPGAVHAIDPDAHTVTTVLDFTGAHDISAGPEDNTLYLIATGFQQPLYRYVIGSPTPVLIGGNVIGNSLGEGRDGFIYMGGGGFGRVDPSTGVVTVLNPFLFFAGDIATSPEGITYGVLGSGALVSIDRGTGLETPIGQLSTSFYGLAFTLDGRMWGVSGAVLYRIDPTTAAFTPEFDTQLAILDLGSEPVPSPSSAALLLAMATWGVGRRRRSHAN